MKYVIIVLAANLLVIFSCSNQNSTDLSRNEEGVVKIITTKAFNAKPEFDKLIPDKPVFDMGYDRTLSMDFTWNTKHLDSFNNILYQEDIILNDKGEEIIFRKTYNQFYSPEENKLSLIRTESEVLGTTIKTEEKYLRDETGRLNEIQILNNGKLDRKIIFSYNETGQKIKKEIFKEEGLSEINSYKYDNPSLTEGLLINEVREAHINDESNYKEEFDYKRNKQNQILKMRRKYSEASKLNSEVTSFSYFDYNNESPTRIVQEGTNPPIGFKESVIGGGDYKLTTTISLNINGDIQEYRTVKEDYAPMNREEHYKLEYVYNKNRDWTQLIFSPNSRNNYIIIREIEYLK